VGGRENRGVNPIKDKTGEKKTLGTLPEGDMGKRSLAYNSKKGWKQRGRQLRGKMVEKGVK